MEKTNIIKIGLVSYLNTLPFVYGIRTMIENQKQWNLKIIQAYPSECTNLFRENKIDIGIIPIGALPNLKNYQIVSKFCLGTKQKVDSVLLLSHKPIKNIDTILLDYQSETSVLMAKILARYYWKINPIWENTTQGLKTKLKTIQQES
ncbi:MAG TPA: hypothetical protein EYP69_05905 [Bacteroidales bacterium]|nr:hypothetical protein [Bacteroidales bacterium]